MLLQLCSERLTGWDFLIAGLIVLFVEYVVKLVVSKSSEKIQKIVFKVSPVAIGLVLYILFAVFQKTDITTSALHGLFVGLTAMGSYDIILKTIKEAGVKGLEDVNQKVKEAIEEDKKN